MSTVYSVRIPKKLKQTLEALNEVDWQTEIRQFLETKARESHLRLELEEARRLRASMKKTVNSAQIIRADRDDAH
jgi:hypothetical protein